MLTDYTRSKTTNKRNYVIAYKATHPCVQCGEARPVCLDFHHVNPEDKLWDISIMVSQNYALSTLKAEIAKCEMLCANCHRVLHMATPEAKPAGIPGRVRPPYVPPERPVTHKLQCNVPEDQYAIMCALADREGVSLATLMRWLIAETFGDFDP